ncbi:hypothetical protein ACUR5C_07430 [Aliikangiella sp. IMCC44653]
MQNTFLKIVSKGLLFLAIFSASTITTQASEWDEAFGDNWEEASPWQQQLSFSALYSPIIKKETINRDPIVASELRGQYEFSYQAKALSVTAELELVYDDLVKQTDFELYQGYLQLPVGNAIDVKLGRQVITWGLGDLIFVNDLMPKDWQAFFNGRDNQYLKPPVDALRLSWFQSWLNFDLVYLPQFKADVLPRGERYSLYIPGIGITQPNPPLAFSQPNDNEMSLRLHKTYQGTEWAVYFYDGYFKSPNSSSEPGIFKYAKMRSWGASSRTLFAAGLLSLEWAFYQSRQDKSGLKPSIPNSQSRWLIGYEQELVKNISLGVQAYLERLEYYAKFVKSELSAGKTRQEIPNQSRSLFTLRLTHLGLKQKLVSSAMLFYSPSQSDAYLRASAEYAMSDHLKLAFGVNYFKGEKDETFFGQFSHNSNVYSRISYTF